MIFFLLSFVFWSISHMLFSPWLLNFRFSYERDLRVILLFNLLLQSVIKNYFCNFWIVKLLIYFLVLHERIWFRFLDSEVCLFLFKLSFVSGFLNLFAPWLLDFRVLLLNVSIDVMNFNSSLDSLFTNSLSKHVSVFFGI